LEVAIEVIDAGGEPALRLDSVVEQAGVAITAVYHHFRNREGLMEAAQAERYVRTIWPTLTGLDELLQTVTSQAELFTVVMAVLDDSIDPAYSMNRRRRVNVVGSTLGRPRLASIVAAEQSQVNQYLASLLRPFQHSGMIRADLDLVAFSGWVVGLILSRVMEELDPECDWGEKWNGITRRAVALLMFGDEGSLSSR
jgi:AcrR family transcriptional regulator